MESLDEIWERHYDSLTTEEKRVSFLLTLKVLRQQGNASAEIAFPRLAKRWIDDKVI